MKVRLLDIRCPECGAEPKKPCITAKGVPFTTTNGSHIARKRMVKRANEAGQ